MQRFCAIVMFLLFVTLSALTQQEAPLKLSDKPLTADQVAVYKVVLRQYDNGSGMAVNVADRTEPLTREDFSCVAKVPFYRAKAISEVHRLDASIFPTSNFVLVNAEEQQKKIKANDPQRLIQSAIDDHVPVSDEKISASVGGAFASGLFTFSEIAFSKDGTRALVSYSFVCGGLCGHGDTLLLKKVGGKWKVSKTCESWIS